uniref:Candidate secreted effector n=1 Tax=Meloidogyne incognita TaxID=6306 RepID=A0A914LPC9_MELIC
MIHQKFNKILLLFLLLIYYARKIEGGNVGEDEGDGGKIIWSEGEVEGEKVEFEGWKGGELGGIGGEIESGKEGQIEVKGGGGKGGELEQGRGELGGIKSDIERGEGGQIEVKEGERVPEQFIKKSDKETKSLKKVWGKIENKKDEIGDEKEYKNDYPSLIDSKNVTKKTMKFKYLSAKKDSSTSNNSEGELDCKQKCLEDSKHIGELDCKEKCLEDPQHIKDEGIEGSELNKLKAENLVSTSEATQKSSGEEEKIDTKNEEVGKGKY